MTTEVVGNCGLSPSPNKPATGDLLRSYVAPALGFQDVPWEWAKFDDYLCQLENSRASVNVAALVAHGTLRVAVMGFENREASSSELAEMKQLLTESLDAGAFGISSGLLYPPGCYAPESELVELCRIVAERGAFYATHIRNEADYLVESVEEALRVARLSGVPLHISHHKAAGRANWGKTKTTVEMIHAARAEGLDVTCDLYPYDSGGNFLTTILPKWTLEGGLGELGGRLRDPAARERIKTEFETGIPGWENFVKMVGWDSIQIVSLPSDRNKPFEGKTLTEIGRMVAKDPAEVALDLLLEEEGNIGIIFCHHMSEEDIETIMRQEFAMFGSDGLYTPVGTKPHPRLYGTFPRVYAEYVRKRGILPLEEAVRKMTSLPASRLGLPRKGVVREDFDADLVVFDERRILDLATYEDPRRLPEGIHHVLVNGEVVIEEGKHTGATPGKVLRRREDA